MSQAALTRTRQQARATGQVKVRQCVVAEAGDWTERPLLIRSEIVRRVRLGEIDRIVAYRHGGSIPDATGTDDMVTVGQYVLAVAGSRGNVDGWLRRWAPWFSDHAAIEKAHGIALKMEGGKRGPIILKADSVAKMMGVTMAERVELDLRTIGAIDLDKKGRAKLAKENQRRRNRENQTRVGDGRDVWSASNGSQTRLSAEISHGKRRG